MPPAVGGQGIVFLLLQHPLPTHTQRKTLVQPSRRSRNHKTYTANHFLRKKIATGEGEEEEHCGVNFLGVDTEL